MKFSAKKIIAVFVTACMLAPLSFLFVFQVKQQVVRHRLKEELEEKMLQSVSLAPSQIHWVEDNREARIDGRLFDVKEVVYNTNGTVTLKGLFDDEETLLVQQLEKRHQQHNSENGKQLIAFFSFQIGMPEDDIICSTQSADAANWGSKANTSLLPVYYKDIPKPPPQIS